MNQRPDIFHALHAAFRKAIDEVGIDALKRTSMFGSNDRAELKKAA
ncbi:hypothetical protein [Paracoccus versutus]|nr:hypothetical protein [Paracoccus versutus]